ncbi:MAG: hypothetical protein ACREMB_24020 [Candidatus Rokuibacteriota bacterium]
MDPTAVEEIMRRYFAERAVPAVPEPFGEQSPLAFLKESVDVVDFVMHLEEGLRRDVDLNQVGEALVTMTFRELALHVSRTLAAVAPRPDPGPRMRDTPAPDRRPS